MQFPDIVEVAEALADAGKTVVVAALDGTFKREGFPCILQLIPRAEEVVKLTAVCMLCFKEASFTKRKTSDHTTVLRRLPSLILLSPPLPVSAGGDRRDGDVPRRLSPLLQSKATTLMLK